MRKKTISLIQIVVFIIVFSLLILPSARAQQEVSSVGIATYLPVTDKVEDGDIIITEKGKYILSQKPYDPQIVGVVSLKPAISLKRDRKEEGVPVVNVGLTLVKVNGENGAINKGDFIASSSRRGVGMKAVRNGYILGQALENASFKNVNEVKLISVNLNLRLLQIDVNPLDSIWQLFSITQLAALEEPVGVFKYILSAIVLIASFGFGFLIFYRAINTGIQALGRNPLAGRMIQLSVLFNVIIVIVIILSGIGIVWLFLKL